MKSKITFAALLWLLSVTAWAWDGAITGKVSSYHIVVNQAGNFELRIYMTGGPLLCTGGSDWAYANSNEINYQALVASVISAKAIGQTVTIYTTKDAYNYCHIGYMVVS